MTDTTETHANAPERSPEKSRALVRDGAGRFAPGNPGGPGPRPKDPTFKALAVADRQRNFDFIRGVRDNVGVDVEVRLEAAKLLVSYSDGKPVTINGPNVQVNVGTGSGAITVGSSGHELYRAALASGADVDEILHMYDQQRALESRHPDGRQAAREPKGTAIEGQAEPASPALEAEPAQLEDTP